MKHIAAAYREALRLHGLTQAEFSRRNRVPGSELTRMCQGQYPNNKVLGALVRGWPDRETGERLLLAHLRDEVERIGETGHAVILRENTANERLGSDLEVIRRFLEKFPDLGEGMALIAGLIRKPETRREASVAVVETEPLARLPAPPPGPVSYGTGGKGRRER